VLPWFSAFQGQGEQIICYVLKCNGPRFPLSAQKPRCICSVIEDFLNGVTLALDTVWQGGRARHGRHQILGIVALRLVDQSSPITAARFHLSGKVELFVCCYHGLCIQYCQIHGTSCSIHVLHSCSFKFVKYRRSTSRGCLGALSKCRVRLSISARLQVMIWILSMIITKVITTCSLF
jgi:hypothetical protein